MAKTAIFRLPRAVDAEDSVFSGVTIQLSSGGAGGVGWLESMCDGEIALDVCALSGEATELAKTWGVLSTWIH